MRDFRHEQGHLQDKPRFDPDPAANVEDEARRYLEATGRYPPGYQLVERIILGFARFIGDLVRAVRGR